MYSFTLLFNLLPDTVTWSYWPQISLHTPFYKSIEMIEILFQLQEKVRTLEKSLSHVVREFETERHIITDNARTESEAARVELCKLQV